MPKETETKFKIASAPEFRKRLRSAKAVFVSKSVERDIYYRPARFAVRAGTIRLRTLGGKGGVFTLKSMAAEKDPRTYKTRDEFEVRVDDAAVFGDMLQRLGFVPVFRKEKRREAYKCKGAGILLDEVPFIGWYVEIEGTKAAIRRLAGLLGLDMEKAIPDTYMDLFQYYKMRHARPDLQMVFGER